MDEPKEKTVEEKKEKKKFDAEEFYQKNYKKLLIIPILMVFLACAQIGYQTYKTGDFIDKGISLKGGLSVTIPYQDGMDTVAMQQKIASELPKNDINIRTLESLGKKTAVVIEANIDENDHAKYDQFLTAIGDSLGKKLGNNDYTVEFFGSSLGASFFKEILMIMVIAFALMAIVVLAFFRSPAPSAAVIASAFSDIIVSVAVVNLLGVKVSTAGIAGFLMLIGYSVDTDILLSTRVLKRTEGTVVSRVFGAMKTGMLMTITTLVSVSIAYFFTNSEVLHQIMLIIIIGLFVDIIATWIFNAGLLMLWLEWRGSKSKKGSE